MKDKPVAIADGSELDHLVALTAAALAGLGPYLGEDDWQWAAKRAARVAAEAHRAVLAEFSRELRR